MQFLEEPVHPEVCFVLHNLNPQEINRGIRNDPGEAQLSTWIFMMEEDHLHDDEDHHIAVGYMVRPGGSEGFVGLREDKVLIDGVANPKDSPDVKAQWKSQTREEVIADLPYHWKIAIRSLVCAHEVIQQCDREVSGLRELKQLFEYQSM